MFLIIDLFLDGCQLFKNIFVCIKSMHRNEFETAGVDHKSYVGVACAEPKESVPSLLNETVASKLKIRNISFFFLSMLYLVLHQPNYQIYSVTSKAIISHFYPL